MKGQSLLSILILIGVILVLGFEAVSLSKSGISDSGSPTGDSKSLREYASQLKANQLYEKSAEVYDDYLARAPISDKEKANIDFNTGKMLLDQVGDAEAALAHFLRVTHLYSEIDPEIKKESRKLSAQCLEVLGRSGAAERELVQASKLGTEGATDEESVDAKDILATIGTRVTVTRNDFDEVWKEIPPQIRQQQFPGKDGKEQLLQEMVASKLFAEAARRKGYDRDPQLRRRIQTLEESLLANQLLQEEVAGKVGISDSDLQLFYEANKAHYADPPSVDVAHILLADATQAEAALAEIEAGSPFEEVAKSRSLDPMTKDKGGSLGTLRQNPPALVGEPPVNPLDISIPGLGKEPAVVEAAFALSEIGEISRPIQSARGFHLIKVSDRTDAVEKNFEETRPLIERDVRQRKQQERQSELVAELMKAHKVRVHRERLN